MSVKIYNAWEWKGSYDDLIKWFNSVKNNQYLNDGLNLIRTCNKKDDEDKWQYEKRIYKEIIDTKLSNERNFLDIDLSAVVIQHLHKIVVCWFGLNDRVFPSVKKEIDKKFKYFGWWDNTDPEEDVSEEEWKYRGDWFEEVFEKYDSTVYSDLGLFYDFSSESLIFKICDQVAREKYIA